jgi:hypothetical protein
MANLPNEDEVLGYFGRLSNLGRWGKDDVLGTGQGMSDAHGVMAATALSRPRTAMASEYLGMTYHPVWVRVHRYSRPRSGYRDHGPVAKGQLRVGSARNHV